MIAVLLFAVARLRRRLELVARAEHELRGALTILTLRHGEADPELARARAALADLTAARQGRRATARPSLVDLHELVRRQSAAYGAHVEWTAGSPRLVADRGRLAQALGNLLANAAEHGNGAVRVSAQRSGSRVQVRVVNPERGRGLGIAAAAAGDVAGRLDLERAGGEFRATLDLPCGG